MPRPQRLARPPAPRPRSKKSPPDAAPDPVRGGVRSSSVARRPQGRTTMQILTQLVYSGIALGMIYAVIAFGYQLTFATSDTLNFGQGDALMLGALVGLSAVLAGIN